MYVFLYTLFFNIYQLDIRLAERPEPIVLKVGGDYSKEDQIAMVSKSKEMISRIRKGISKIQLQQQRDRHRLILHSEMSKRSHQRVLQGSIIETSCFIAAALFQIFFVRRWFASKTGHARPWA
jgi:hypothetical protein